jgi:chromosome segregation ATPase
MNNKDEQIKGLEEKMNNKDKIHEEEINTLKKEMEILSKNLNSLDEKSNSYDTNYVRFLNILDKMIISAQYVSLNLKEILSKKSEQVKNRIEAIATAYDECALEYFKDSNDPTFLSGLIIGNLEEESNAEECQKILDYLDNKIKKGILKIISKH